MTKIAEYLCVGQPIVAYDLAETRRTAGGAAILVAPGNEAAFADAVVSLGCDPERRRHYSALARRRARSLSWCHSERALLDAYRRMIPATQAPAPCRTWRFQAAADEREDEPVALDGTGSNGARRA